MARKIRGRNEGSIFQRKNGTWRAQFSLENGKRISKSFKAKSEALVWLRKQHDQIAQGYDHEAGKTSLGEYLSQWLETHRASINETTAYHYVLIIDKHINPHIGSIALKDLRLDRIERLYGQLAESGLGIRTIRMTHSVLHCALEKAVKYGLVLRNPAHGAALPRYRHAEMNILDPTQVNRFLITAKGSQHEGLYYLAVYTGMRQGELFGLKWPDLQWQTGVLHVQRQVKYIPGKGLIFSEPKTRAGQRTIQLGEGVLQTLREHRQRQELQKISQGDNWTEFNLMFPCSKGTPADSSNLRKDFYYTLENAGLPKIRFHDLRHTAASLMLNNGIPVIVVSKIVGHSKPSITLDTYGHLLHGMQSEAARLMDELIRPIPIAIEEFSDCNMDSSLGEIGSSRR